MYKIKLVLVIMVLALFNSCQTVEKGEHSTNLNLVPYPAKVYEQKGEFELNSGTVITVHDESSKLAAEFLQGFLETATGFKNPVGSRKGDSNIRFERVKSMSNKAYRLSITPNKVIIKASSEAGFFYGVETFRQLFLGEIERKTTLQQDWKVACVEIEDEPNYDYHGIRFFDVAAKLGRNAQGSLIVALNTFNPNGEIRFTTNGETPTMEASIYENAFELGEGEEVRAIVFEDGKPISNALAVPFKKHKAAIRTINVTTPPHPKFREGGNEALVNGVLGNNNKFGDGEWLGWEGENIEVKLDLGSFTEIKEMTLRFFNSPDQLIYLPKGIKIEFSKDNQTFVPITEFKDITATKEKVLDVTLGLPTSVQYIKVIVENYGMIPTGKEGAGNKAWLFLDEIIVE